MFNVQNYLVIVDMGQCASVLVCFNENFSVFNVLDKQNNRIEIDSIKLSDESYVSAIISFVFTNNLRF